MTEGTSNWKDGRKKFKYGIYFQICCERKKNSKLNLHTCLFCSNFRKIFFNSKKDINYLYFTIKTYPVII